jgi:hypothetical protein
MHGLMSIKFKKERQFLICRKTEGTSKINYTYVRAVFCKETAHQNPRCGFLDYLESTNLTVCSTKSFTGTYTCLAQVGYAVLP